MVLIASDPAYGAVKTPDNMPLSEFREIARRSHGTIESFTAGCAVRGKWFAALFRKFPKLGAAVHASGVAFRYEAIYTTGEDLGLPLALLLRMRRWRGRLVCVFHNMTPRKRLLLQLVGARAFHALITVSESQRQALIAGSLVDPQRVLNVRNWVDTEFFSPSLDDEMNGYLIACGAENRDYQTLVDAARHLPIKIKVFGHGFLAAADRISGDAPPNFEFCPRVDYSELRAAYAGAQAVILPLHDVEYAAGVTGLVEAMAMGKAIIVSDSKGISDYLSVHNPGIVIEPGNSNALVEAVMTLTANPDAFKAVANENRSWAVDYCSLKAYAGLVISLLEAKTD